MRSVRTAEAKSRDPDAAGIAAVVSLARRRPLRNPCEPELVAVETAAEGIPAEIHEEAEDFEDGLQLPEAGEAGEGVLGRGGRRGLCLREGDPSGDPLVAGGGRHCDLRQHGLPGQESRSAILGALSLRARPRPTRQAARKSGLAPFPAPTWCGLQSQRRAISRQRSAVSYRQADG